MMDCWYWCVFGKYVFFGFPKYLPDTVSEVIGLSDIGRISVGIINYRTIFLLSRKVSS